MSSGPATTSSPPAAFARRLVLLVLALGLVLMHHLVAARDAPTGHGHDPAVAQVSAEHAEHAAVPAPPVAPDAPAGHDAHALVHQCLAVLAAIAALGVVLALVHPARTSSGAGVAAAPRRHGGEPPVPRVPLRLAQLQVLRR